MVVEHIPFGPFVNESERKALETLKSRLTGFQGKGKWLLLTNVMFSARQERLSDEIDMIAIGPTGLHIIEIKHWNQYQIKERPLWIEEQADILNTKVKIIKSKISRDIDVGFLEGKILFTKGNYRAPENKPRPVYRGVKVYGLPEWRDLLEIEGRAILTIEWLRQYAERLSRKPGWQLPVIFVTLASILIWREFRRQRTVFIVFLKEPIKPDVIGSFCIFMTCRLRTKKMPINWPNESLTQFNDCRNPNGYHACSIPFKVSPSIPAKYIISLL